MNGNGSDLWKDALGRGAGCPPIERLVDAAFAEEPTAEERALLAHASGCAACAAELELAGAFTGAARSAGEAEEIAWIESRVDVAKALPERGSKGAESPSLARVLPMRRKESKPQAPAAWTRWAAAALILVGIGVTLRYSGPARPPALPDGPATDLVRGGQLFLEGPVGELAVRPARFDWQSVPGAVSYVLEVRDVAGDLVERAETGASALETAGPFASRLESHVSYSWIVVARDAAGLEIARSSPAIFSFSN
jgi:hypothetical protein